MKRLLSLLLAVLMLIGSMTVCVQAEDTGMSDSGIDYTESTEMITNPHMGYPSHASISMKIEGNTARNDSGFMWYYINISAFSGSNSGLPDNVTWPEDRVDRDISADALAALQGTLENLRQNGGSCLIRFVYDWDGQPGREPSTLDQILRHIEQLCGVVADYDDICLGFECGIIGVFGEMHSSIYCGSAFANPIIDAYLDNTPDTMMLMVRTPAYVMQYLGLTRWEVANFVTEYGSNEYRLSYFNDGYMNSDNDLGTWGDRKADLAFLERQSDHAPYGGEYGSAYWILPCNSCLPENAIPEMYRTHVNFIRGNVYSTKQNEYFGYDSYPYTKEYEIEGFPDNSAFYGEDCFTFIKAHLGYRLVLRESKLTSAPKAGGTLRLTGSIENTGFANVLHYPTTQIMLVNNGYTYVCDVSLDASVIKSCTVQDYDLSLNLPASMPEGDYQVYMRMAASTQTQYTSAKSGIAFANAESLYDKTLGANYIGTINVKSADQPTSAMSDTFCEVGENCVEDALITAGAPLLYGHGLTKEGDGLTLNYHTGDTITLQGMHMVRQDAKITYSWYHGTEVVGKEEILVIENATSADAGEYKLTAKSGGKSYTTVTVTVTVDNHRFGGYQTVTEAGCHTPGKQVRKCTDCSLTETKYLPTNKHIAGDLVTVDSTCTVRGNTSVRCTECEDLLEFKLLDLLPHDYRDEISEATCTLNGKITYTCRDCSYSYAETLEPLGHDYIYRIDGNKASAACFRCQDPREEEVFDGDLGTGITSDEFDGTLKGAVSVDTAPLPLIGENGYVTEYMADDAKYITFLLKFEGVETEMEIGKFRTLAYAKDDTKNLGDSNNNGNYSGKPFQVTEDGVWAFSIRKYLMLPYGNYGFGKIQWAAFNDEGSNKGAAPVNKNENATVELLGIYESLLDYTVLYTDSDGRFLRYSEGGYNTHINWSNLISKVKTVNEAYEGLTPTKRATKDTVYTFSGWKTSDGRTDALALGNLIVSPVFEESANSCNHKKTKTDIIKAPTCTEPGEASTVCVDCGAPMDTASEVKPTGHVNEVVRVTEKPTFKLEGKQEIYCGDCMIYLRSETVAKVKNNFTDVDINKWYSDAVAYVTSNGIFNGVSETLFRPSTSVTRAMFVTVLGRLSGVNPDHDKKTAFDDVETGRYYTGYVAWANEAGIVNGRSETRFAPDASITREEMCVMIIRYCDFEKIALKNNAATSDTFADSTQFAKWSLNEIERCRKAGLINGKSTTATGMPLFVPKGDATRAEVAKILYSLNSMYMS